MDNNILDTDLYQSELNLVKASKGKRFANLLIDYILAIILVVIAMFVMDLTGLSFIYENAFGERLTGMLFFALYYILTEGMLKGKSIGKFITKTRAVSADGSHMDFSTVIKRSFSRIVPFDAFSFLGSEPTGWHDRWTDTIVIDENISPAPVNL